MSFKRKKKRASISVKTKTRMLPPNFFTAFGKEMLLKADEGTREFAKSLAKEAKTIIREQSYTWKPLKETYAKRKERLGLDARILMATKTYVNKGIGYYEKDGFMFVGPLPGIHKPSGLTYRALGRILEFGTWSIPPRPFWRPLLSVALRRSKEFRRKFNRSSKTTLNKRLKEKSETVTKKV